jgi:acyl-CoA dehydrogenase
LADIQIACDELLNNFPIHWLGKVLRWIIFPYGTAYRRPSDSLHHKIVAPMLKPSEFRDRLTRYFYMNNHHSDPAYRMESAFTQVASVEPILKKFQIAIRNGALPRLASLADNLISAQKIGVLTAEEASALQEFDALYKEVIKVDEFSFDLNTVLTAD